MQGNNIYTLASGLYEELARPSGIAIEYISGWLVNNIGTLNNLIDTNFVSSGNSFLGTPGDLASGILDNSLGFEETAIYRSLFMLHYLQREGSRLTNAAGYDSWIELEDDGSRIRRTAKLDLSKYYAAQSKEQSLALKDLVVKYRMNHANPQNVYNDGFENAEDFPYLYAYPSVLPFGGRGHV